MARYADRTGNVHSADVVWQDRTLGIIVYEGPTRGPLRVQTELQGSFILAKLVDTSGFVKKRAQFHQKPARWAG